MDQDEGDRRSGDTHDVQYDEGKPNTKRDAEDRGNGSHNHGMLRPEPGHRDEDRTQGRKGKDDKYNKTQELPERLLAVGTQQEMDRRGSRTCRWFTIR